MEFESFLGVVQGLCLCIVIFGPIQVKVPLQRFDVIKYRRNCTLDGRNGAERSVDVQVTEPDIIVAPLDDVGYLFL